VLQGLPREMSVVRRDRANPEVALVANRPRFGCYSPARAGSAIWWQLKVQLGRSQVARWRGRPSVHINVLLR
jgi:hypothetical protein